MKLTKFAAVFAVAGVLGASVHAQENLTAETANAAGVPGNTVLALGEFAGAAGVADIQVATGQTLTNSLQNTAEGKTDITAAPFILPFLMSKGAGPYEIGQRNRCQDGRHVVGFVHIPLWCVHFVDL